MQCFVTEVLSQVDMAGSEGVTWLITTSLRQITEKFPRL